MNWFKMLYTLFGGLGLFVFGITSFSESLQSMGSNIIKKAIKLATDKPILAVLTGLTITSIIQSSSVTTVMLVSFVNAGLMSLTQAIGAILGANIGTTITGWIIAINVGKYGLLLIALGIFPMIFARSNRWKTIGKCIFSLGLIFFGLELMGMAFKPLRNNDSFLKYLVIFSADNIPSVLACVMIGCGLTMIIQSSSAMLGITISLAVTGIISFQTAVALVLGENIGTTITALLASINTNTAGRRAARAHACFNVLGVFTMVLIFRFYIPFIEWLIGGAADYTLANGSKPNIAAHIAASHTVFNVSATILFLPFVKHLAKFVTWITPEPEQKEINKLKFIGEVDNMSPELAIIEAKQEMFKMSKIVDKTLMLTREYMTEDKPDNKKADEVKKHEGITDNIQKEITLFLHKVMEASLNPEQTKMVNTVLRTSDELESVGDYCESLIDYRKRLFEIIDKFTPESIMILSEYLEDVHAFYRESLTVLDNPGFSLKKHRSRYSELGNKADKIREIHLEHIKNGKYDPLSGLTFSDIMVALRRIKNHSLNIAEALTGGKALN